MSVASLIVFKFSFSSAMSCESFISHRVLNSQSVVVNHNGFFDIISYPSELSPLEILAADKAVITDVTKALRANPNYIATMDQNDVNLLLQVFTRHNEESSPFGLEGNPDLRSLSESEILTFAVIEFNVKSDPRRAKKALQRIRGLRGESPGISVATQYRFNRVLRHLLQFHVADNNQEAAERIIQILIRREK